MMRREPVLALQCTKRTKRVGGSQKGPSGPPPRGEGEVSLAKIAKAMQRCDNTAGLAECVRERRPERDVGTMSKTASNAAVFGRIPMGT